MRCLCCMWGTHKDKLFTKTNLRYESIRWSRINIFSQIRPLVLEERRGRSLEFRWCAARSTSFCWSKSFAWIFWALGNISHRENRQFCSVLQRWCQIRQEQFYIKSPALVHCENFIFCTKRACIFNSCRAKDYKRLKFFFQTFTRQDVLAVTLAKNSI